jgi:hypothetical protein
MIRPHSGGAAASDSDEVPVDGDRYGVLAGRVHDELIVAALLEAGVLGR